MVHIEEVTEEEALELKEKANRAFAKQDFDTAIRLFTDALRLADSNELQATLHSNRGLAKLKLERPADALEDFTTALKRHPKYDKAAYHKGRCELRLRRLDDAEATFTALMRANLQAKMRADVDEHLRALARRRKEQGAGDYDFAALYALPQGADTESVGYLGPVAVTLVPGKGRGVVVTRDVAVGELLFADKAFAVGPKPALLQKTVKKLRHCPKQVLDEFWALSDGATVPDVRTTGTLTAQERPVLGSEVSEARDVDADRVKRVLDCNAHCAGTMDATTGLADESSTSGLFLLASLVNHSCRPTATRVFLGDMLFCRAARSLREGEEVTDAYVSILQPLHARREALRVHSGFDLRDDRAAVEALLPQAEAQKLLDRIDEIGNNMSAGTLGKSLKAYQGLMAVVAERCAEAARGLNANKDAAAAAQRLGLHAEGVARMLCGNFAAGFVGLAICAKQLGRWGEAVVGYWDLCSFQEQNAPCSAYHASWAWELLQAAKKAGGDTAPHAAYCRHVFRVYYGPGVLDKGLGDRDGPLPPDPRGGAPASEPAPMPEPAEPEPATAAAERALTARVERAEGALRVVVELGGRDHRDADLQVSAEALRVRVGAEEVSVRLPVAVQAEEAPAAKYSKKRQELTVTLPVV